MFSAVHVAGMSLLLMAQGQAGSRPSELYREEFRQRPESAVLSKEFSGDAWVVLLYASRQGSAEQANQPGGDPTDDAMERLRGEVKTDGEWLFWYRLSRWSVARRAQAQGGGPRVLQDVDACRSALMLANRARVMKAAMPACEAASAAVPGRKP